MTAQEQLCTGGGLEVTLRAGVAALLPYVRAGAVALALIAVTGCSRDSPQAELDATVQTLQDNLEAKRAGRMPKVRERHRPGPSSTRWRPPR